MKWEKFYWGKCLGSPHTGYDPGLKSSRDLGFTGKIGMVAHPKVLGDPGACPPDKN